MVRKLLLAHFKVSQETWAPSNLCSRKSRTRFSSPTNLRSFLYPRGYDTPSIETWSPPSNSKYTRRTGRKRLNEYKTTRRQNCTCIHFAGFCKGLHATCSFSNLASFPDHSASNCNCKVFQSDISTSRWVRKPTVMHLCIAFCIDLSVDWHG